MSHFHLLRDVPIFWWHAWGTIVLPLLLGLGILTILFAACTVVTRYIECRIKRTSHSEAASQSGQYFHDNVLTPSLTMLGLFLVLGTALGPYEIHQQDIAKIADRNSLAGQIGDLQAQLQLARNNLDVGTPAANNLIFVAGFSELQGGAWGILSNFMPSSANVSAGRRTDRKHCGPVLHSGYEL